MGRVRASAGTGARGWHARRCPCVPSGLGGGSQVKRSHALPPLRLVCLCGSCKSATQARGPTWEVWAFLARLRRATRQIGEGHKERNCESTADFDRIFLSRYLNIGGPFYSYTIETRHDSIIEYRPRNYRSRSVAGLQVHCYSVLRRTQSTVCVR